jgi:predicted PurR-regulated permease PerM
MAKLLVLKASEVVNIPLMSDGSVAILSIVVLFLLVLLCTLVFSMNQAVATLVNRQNDMIKDTNTAIRENTETLKRLDITIKDRLLTYLESQVGTNANNND